MAETDVFNPSDWQAAGLCFNPNPSYGFTRKMGANRQLQRPRLGIYPTRDIANGGHIFSLTWVGTDLGTMHRINDFYHNFKAGYFTLIDQDDLKRHYVGRFMSEPEPAHVANGKYTIQGLVFEEQPQARMLNYPSNFGVWGRQLNVVDDYLNPRVALMQGNWTIQISPTSEAGATNSTPAALEAIDVTPAAGDWAQTAWVGWGFQITFRLAGNLGVISLALDGIQIVGTLDLSSGAATVVSAGVTIALVNKSFEDGNVLFGSFVSVTMTSVVLDMHRLKISYVGASAAHGVSIIYPSLLYIY